MRVILMLICQWSSQNELTITILVWYHKEGNRLRSSHSIGTMLTTMSQWESINYCNLEWWVRWDHRKYKITTDLCHNSRFLTNKLFVQKELTSRNKSLNRHRPHISVTLNTSSEKSNYKKKKWKKLKKEYVNWKMNNFYLKHHKHQRHQDLRAIEAYQKLTQLWRLDIW